MGVIDFLKSLLLYAKFFRRWVELQPTMNFIIFVRVPFYDTLIQFEQRLFRHLWN